MPAPMDQVPGSSGNDGVTSTQNDIMSFIGQPLEVWTYLQDPTHIVDDTAVIYSPQAPAPYGMTMCMAGEYLELFPIVYPDITLPS